MSFTGKNKMCQQCVHNCKQWQQNKLDGCRIFRSVQKKKPEQEGQIENGDTLQA